jgi:hypothetical protein
MSLTHSGRHVHGTILLLDFGFDPTVCYFFYFILLHILGISSADTVMVKSSGFFLSTYVIY